MRALSTGLGVSGGLTASVTPHRVRGLVWDKSEISFTEAVLLALAFLSSPSCLPGYYFPSILQAAAKTPLPVGTFSDLPDPGGGFLLPVFPSAHYHGITGCYTELREGSNTGAAKIEQAP